MTATLTETKSFFEERWEDYIAFLESQVRLKEEEEEEEDEVKEKKESS